MQMEQLICTKIIDMMESIPYNEIKVSEFAKFAEVSRSTFYFYFDSIPLAVEKIEDDFVLGLTDDHTAIMRIISSKSGKMTTQEMIYPTVNYVQKNLRTFRVLSGPNGNPAFQRKMAVRQQRMMDLMYAKSEMTTNNRELISEFMSGSQWYIYSWWAQHEDQFTLEEMIQFIARYVDSLSHFFLW